mgnify:CR=1 FL=1
MDKKKSFRLTKGLAFTFFDGDVEIEAWFSNLTGKEEVYVNGELRCSKRSFSVTTSTNDFNVNGNKYSVSMNLDDFWKSKFYCTLNKNGKLFQRKQMVFTRKVSFLITLISILSGLVSVCLLWKFHASFDVCLAGFIGGSIVGFLLAFRYVKPVVEDVPLA